MKALLVINKHPWWVCIQSQVENNPIVLYHLSFFFFFKKRGGKEEEEEE